MTDYNLDLSHSVFCGADFATRDFCKTNFTGADLSWANLCHLRAIKHQQHDFSITDCISFNLDLFGVFAMAANPPPAAYLPTRRRFHQRDLVEANETPSEGN